MLDEAGVSTVMGKSDVGTPQLYTWSSDLGGHWFGDKDLRVWHAAGINLLHYLVPPLCERSKAPVETNLIAHSHGLQVALYACAEGLLVNTLISVGSPIRHDMLRVAEQARKNIAYWLHIHSDESDRMQWLGELFDGHLGVVRRHPLADWNESVSGMGHSQVLRDPSRYGLWSSRGWLEALHTRWRWK